MHRALALAILLPACTAAEGSPDARVYQDDLDADAGSPYPGFRDAGCPGGSTSGTSGAGCGDGGSSGEVLVDAALPDAALPDAAPPCDQVTFYYASGDVSSVWVSGTFTEPEWAEQPPGALELEEVSAGEWELTTQIGPGYHEYKFILDGDTWIADPENPDTVDDDFGGENSVLELCE
jgi:hypothetical protein